MGANVRTPPPFLQPLHITSPSGTTVFRMHPLSPGRHLGGWILHCTFTHTQCHLRAHAPGHPICNCKLAPAYHFSFLSPPPFFFCTMPGLCVLLLITCLPPAEGKLSQRGIVRFVPSVQRIVGTCEYLGNARGWHVTGGGGEGGG